MTLQQILADYLRPKITDFRLQISLQRAQGWVRLQIADFSGVDICKGRGGAESDFRFQISTGPAADFQRVRLQIADANTGLGSSRKSSADFRFQISDGTELQGGLKKREADYRFQISDAKAGEKWVWEALEISDNLLGDYIL